jgi:signal transduction histidine kinase/CheY-like chemotaxis protein
MTSTSMKQNPAPWRPEWLWRLYAYIGAHTHALRADNERDRARQRMFISAFAVAWAYGYVLVTGTPVTTKLIMWIATGLLYGTAALAFWLYLVRHPAGGVHVQYAFMLLDPLMIGWALYAAPQMFAWFAVLMLVTVVRVGFRYGLNAMKVELVVACAAALWPLLSGSLLNVQIQTGASLTVMLVWAWWLFAPLIRSAEKAKQAQIEREVEKTKFDEMTNALRSKSDFLSQVSHELRSPLQRVVSALDVIEARFAKDPAEAELLSRIRRGTTALNTQIRDLLIVARGDAGKMEINPIPFEACELALSAARELQGEAQANGLELRVDVPVEPIFVVADPDRIDQILTNLLSNAIRHTHAGHVRLLLEPFDMRRSLLQFSVSDTGPGIDPDRVPALFEPFSRFGAMTRNDDGAGLGLAVVGSILRFIGGSLSIVSQERAGTTFKIEIPCEQAEASRDRLAPVPRPGRVLVVDDRQEVLEAIASVVHQLGFECDTAPSAALAANALGARRYGTVFIDLDMPVKGGRELASDTRRGGGPNAVSRLVSMSGANEGAGLREWPFDDNLAKPITLQAIQRVIGQSTLAAAVPR